MLPEKKTIWLRLVYQDREYPVRTAHREYHSLMSLVSDQLAIAGFGLCSGMGSCGTCIVKVQRSSGQGSYSGLSCGIPVNDDLANAVITVREEYY